MPDIPLTDGRRLYPAMRRGTGMLITTTRTSGLSGRGWADRIESVATDGERLAAPAVVIRPDGHIVWLGDQHACLDAALERWFGRPQADPASA